MPFASFNPTNPRTNPWNFHKKILRIGDFEKWRFFESAILNFFFEKKFFFASSPWKLVTNRVLEWMGLNFYHYDGLQPKMSAEIINEHECIILSTFLCCQLWSLQSRLKALCSTHSIISSSTRTQYMSWFSSSISCLMTI